jgi:glycosyltransferase involved in cell wall biosynthesis
LWPPAILALARTLSRLSPEILVLHDPHAVSAGVLAGRLAGRPRLVAVRRVDFPLRGPLSRRKYAACDRVIAVSRRVASVLEAGGLDPARIRLVYEGVPERAPQPGGEEILREMGVPPGAPVVGNVAALTGHKDHRTLIEAMALLRRRAPEARLFIAGEGELRPRLEALVAERGLGDRVVFGGFRHDLDRLLPAFTAFCLSSHLEGLGTSVLDAMAFGLPVVATAAGGIPESVEDGVTGRLVPPGDAAALAAALCEVLEDEERRRALGAAGRRRFRERFTAAQMAEETARVLREVA